jgi:uncharacterized protein YprB with RNaseH-like and TPR domain
VTRQALTRWIKREAGEDERKYNAMLADAKQGLGFSPLTGQIAAIGVFDTDRNQGVVYYQAPDNNESETREENFLFKPRTEKEMLENFWTGALSYNEFVSFNGRSFDVPFLVTRSAVNQVKPTMNLLYDRYNKNTIGCKHIDLMDQLTFHGVMRRRGSLHLYCRAFGINSPKAGGITGDDVGRLFSEKKYKDIADYNSWDLIATWELYKVWKEYFKML